MAAKVQPRDISPLLQKLRQFLLGRKHTMAVRFADSVSTRSPPPPQIPDGPCHGLNSNYYCIRDVRREVKPPTVIASPHASIEAGEAAAEPKKLATPGRIYQWD